MKKKTIVITGGADGIGLSIAKKFNDNNYNIIIIDNNLKSINKIKDKNIHCYYADVSSEKQMSYVYLDIGKKFNHIDVLVNNAAKQTESSFNDTIYAEWKKVIDTNLNGTFLTIKNSINFMKNGSTILNVISVHYNKPRKNKYAYDASKAAIAILTQELALEFAHKNITVNALSFGAVKTNMNKDWINNDEKVKQVLSKVPLNKIFTSDEIASFAYSIINDFSIYSTGSIFTIDAGRSLT